MKALVNIAKICAILLGVFMTMVSLSGLFDFGPQSHDSPPPSIYKRIGMFGPLLIMSVAMLVPLKVLNGLFKRLTIALLIVPGLVILILSTTKLVLLDDGVERITSIPIAMDAIIIAYIAVVLFEEKLLGKELEQQNS